MTAFSTDSSPSPKLIKRPWPAATSPNRLSQSLTSYSLAQFRAEKRFFAPARGPAIFFMSPEASAALPQDSRASHSLQQRLARCARNPVRLRIPTQLNALLKPHLYPQPRIAQGLWLVRHSRAKRPSTSAMDYPPISLIFAKNPVSPPKSMPPLFPSILPRR